MGFFSFLFKRKKPKEIKLGLALGSGGAKGFAELGALYAFEQNGISFDIIAGTSIGSIIGAFYADGYTSTDIMELLKTVNPAEITNVFMLQMDTIGLFNVIDKSIGNKNIEELKKPFKAVATELETGEQYVFTTGSVATALCASSSYPPFFKPVVVGDKRMIDGAFTNSVPADLVKDMGADFIVGIDLANHEEKPSLINKIFPIYQSKVKTPWEAGYKNSDVMLHPNLSEYKSISFSQASEIYEIGYNCAINAMPEIIKKINALKNNSK